MYDDNEIRKNLNLGYKRNNSFIDLNNLNITNNKKLNEKNDSKKKNNKQNVINNNYNISNDNKKNYIKPNPNININNNNYIKLNEVCPLSLGKNLFDGKMSFIIPKNTPIPSKKSKIYQTTKDYQKRLSVEVYEGERLFVKDNLHLDTFYIENIKRAKKGETKIEVTFELDSNSILKVFAKEIGNDKNFGNIIIRREKRKDEEIQRMIKEAKEFKNDDLEKKKNVESKNKLYYFLNEINKNDFYQINKKEIDDKIRKEKIWLKNHPHEKSEEYEKIIDNLNNYLHQLKFK